MPTAVYIYIYIYVYTYVGISDSADGFADGGIPGALGVLPGGLVGGDRHLCDASISRLHMWVIYTGFESAFPGPMEVLR